MTVHRLTSILLVSAALLLSGCGKVDGVLDERVAAANAAADRAEKAQKAAEKAAQIARGQQASADFAAADDAEAGAPVEGDEGSPAQGDKRGDGPPPPGISGEVATSADIPAPGSIVPPPEGAVVTPIAR